MFEEVWEGTTCVFLSSVDGAPVGFVKDNRFGFLGGLVAASRSTGASEDESVPWISNTI